MKPRYVRTDSPSRRVVQTGRSSTGNISNDPSYESYYHPRVSRELVPGPRVSGERILGPQMSQLRDPRDDGSVRRPPDDYFVQPRHALALNPTSSRRPVSFSGGVAPMHYNPIISRGSEQVSSPLRVRPREDESFYLLPATSSKQERHQRNYSAENSTYSQGSLIRLPRPERGGYRSSGVGSSRAYNVEPPSIRPPRDEDDRDFGYEYTDRREQVYRDTEPRARSRRQSDGSKRERPLSLSGLEDHLPRVNPSVRENGPPVTTRGFNKLAPATTTTQYRYPRSSESSSSDLVPRSAAEDSKGDGSERRRSTRAPLALHQHSIEGYSSRDDRRRYPESNKGSNHRASSVERGPTLRDQGPTSPRIEHDRTRRERGKDHGPERDDAHHQDNRRRSERNDLADRERRRRDDPPRGKERDGKVVEGVAIGLGGSAAATLLGESLKDRRKKDANPDNLEADGSIRDGSSTHGRGGLSSILQTRESARRNELDSEEDSSDRRRRQRKEAEDLKTQDGSRARNNDAKVSERRGKRETATHERSVRPPLADPRMENQKHRHRHHHRTSDDTSYSDTSDGDYRQPREHRSSEVRVVSPPMNPEPRPKGILRPPREKFPEDPAPIREGVAPLKDAGAKGVPPNARWTKIDRRLVNPDALTIGKERFEERPDYVIVLRVLSKDEIEAYAAKTLELRKLRFEEDERLRLEEADSAHHEPLSLADYAYYDQGDIDDDHDGETRDQENHYTHDGRYDLRRPMASGALDDSSGRSQDRSLGSPTQPTSSMRLDQPTSRQSSQSGYATYPPPPPRQEYPPPPPPPMAKPAVRDV